MDGLKFQRIWGRAVTLSDIACDVNLGGSAMRSSTCFLPHKRFTIGLDCTRGSSQTLNGRVSHRQKVTTCFLPIPSHLLTATDQLGT
jgi:hypothetical protein